MWSRLVWKMNSVQNVNSKQNTKMQGGEGGQVCQIACLNI